MENKEEEGAVEDKKNHKVWHRQQEIILQEWSEIASSWRWLHYHSHLKYRTQNIWLTLPVIILSTIAGTANFSQGSFHGSFIQIYLPLLIGFLNLVSGLITTIAQFLKVSERSENHRTSSLAFGKLARNIKIEINLQIRDRTNNGKDFLKICRSELDRLLEQSAIIPMDIVKKYEDKFKNSELYEPEILDIQKVSIYDDPQAKSIPIFYDSQQMKKSVVCNSPGYKQPNIRRSISSSSSEAIKNIQRSLSRRFFNISPPTIVEKELEDSVRQLAVKVQLENEKSRNNSEESKDIEDQKSDISPL
jgi:hypothetical protein